MKKVITAFKEYKEFQEKRPWDVNMMRFDSDILTPPHYAETIEILLCCNIKGTAYIGGNRFELKGKQVFFIAPNIIHSMQYQKNSGSLLVVKLHPGNLMPFIHLQNILSVGNMNFSSIPCYLPVYEELIIFTEQLCNSSLITVSSLHAILSIFDILLQYTSEEKLQTHLPLIDNALCEIISWTEQHFTEKITLDEIAQRMGYNKNYFCSKFKQATGETYLQYLNSLRIFHACSLLKNGASISSACDKCGFGNMSYFIQLFKKIVGTTPKKYISE